MDAEQLNAGGSGRQGQAVRCCFGKECLLGLRTRRGYRFRSQKGGKGSGMARSVIKAVPIAILKPMIGASAAVKKTLMGIHSSLDPKRKKEMEDKYK